MTSVRVSDPLLNIHNIQSANTSTSNLFWSNDWFSYHHDDQWKMPWDIFSVTTSDMFEDMSEDMSSEAAEDNMGELSWVNHYHLQLHLKLQVDALSS